MSLIKSISGIRGTIGGKKGENLTPLDIVECTAGFAKWIIDQGQKPKVVVGRDGRISGPMVQNLVMNTLVACGIDVIDLGLSTTPTVEIAVPLENAGAGIIITASHNPMEWNALKFLNYKGEFISALDGKHILDTIKSQSFYFAQVLALGKVETKTGYIDIHIDQILDLEWVLTEKIKEQKYHIIIDAVNSTGALAIPPLLEKLGCTSEVINHDVNGEFAHNPEPLPQHLVSLIEKVKESKADLGIAVDPDVDRLAFVAEDGTFFGEEYTLVAVSDYILGKQRGAAVSNLSSTRALKDVCDEYGVKYEASAVGEVNVVNKMKEIKAIIGGEGNGGIILPALHYGRDALVGIALFLSHLAQYKLTASKLRTRYRDYYMAKKKVQLLPGMKPDELISKMTSLYQKAKINTIDGLKIDFENEWLHLRKSNTEPIIRVYAESNSQENAERLADACISQMKDLMN